MSAPFGGTPALPFNTVNTAPPAQSTSRQRIYDDLAALPRPRKHYQRYYTIREANENMWHARQGLHDFLRGYYHFKSADWGGNRPTDWRPAPQRNEPRCPTLHHAAEPGHGRNCGGGHAVSGTHCSQHLIARLGSGGVHHGICTDRPSRRPKPLSDGPQPYRVEEVELYAGKTIDQPSMFISGASDWGTYQKPGSFERMQESACTDMREVHLLDGAGYWVQQEQAEATSQLLLEFLGGLG